MAKRRGRPRKDGPRDRAGRLIRDGKFTPPPEHILAKRKLYSFVTPSKGPDGRVGEIDQDICDGIGELHALGLLEGHGIDAQDLRDKGREWRNLWLKWMRGSSAKASGYERTDGSPSKDLFYADALSPMERARFERLDDGINSFDRSVLLSLLVDPELGSTRYSSWVESVIGEALLKRGKLVKMMRFPDSSDRAYLAAAIRGLCSIVDGALPSRWERNAA